MEAWDLEAFIIYSSLLIPSPEYFFSSYFFSPLNFLDLNIHNNFKWRIIHQFLEIADSQKLHFQVTNMNNEFLECICLKSMLCFLMEL